MRIVYGMQHLAYGKRYINMRILQTMVFGIPLVLGLRTGMQDSHVCSGLWGPCKRPSSRARWASHLQGVRVQDVADERWCPWHVHMGSGQYVECSINWGPVLGSLCDCCKSILGVGNSHVFLIPKDTDPLPGV